MSEQLIYLAGKPDMTEKDWSAVLDSFYDYRRETCHISDFVSRTECVIYENMRNGADKLCNMTDCPRKEEWLNRLGLTSKKGSL